jgi:hypothetical protein
MMKFVSFLIIAFGVLLCSCGGQKVIYAKYGKFSLSEGEVNSYPVSDGDIGLFDQCCYTVSENIFLNRVVHHAGSDYHIYISVSEALLQSDMDAVIRADGNLKVMETKSELISKIKVNAYLIEKGGKVFSRFVFPEAKSGLLIIYDFASSNEKLVRNNYDQMVTYLDGKVRL